LESDVRHVSDEIVGSLPATTNYEDRQRGDSALPLLFPRIVD
jgi:hypothetical protein